MKNLSSLFCLCLAVAGAVACDDDSSAPRVPAADAAASPVKPADENKHAAGEPNALPPTSVDSEDADSEPLATESPEQDPASQTVKLKLDVAPHSAHAVVWWGKQKLGEAPLTIERPRRSGPVNLVVKADGFLDHHTRLFTDRDDKLSVSLVRPRDAVGMLGFKRKPGMGLPIPDSGVSGGPGVVPGSATGTPAAVPAPPASQPEAPPNL